MITLTRGRNVAAVTTYQQIGGVRTIGVGGVAAKAATVYERLRKRANRAQAQFSPASHAASWERGYKAGVRDALQELMLDLT